MQQRIEETADMFGPDLIIIYNKGNKSIFPFFNPVSSGTDRPENRLSRADN